MLRFPGNKTPSISFTMTEAMATAHQLPREHKFITHDIKQSLGVFSLPRSKSLLQLLSNLIAHVVSESNLLHFIFFIDIFFLSSCIFKS